MIPSASPPHGQPTVPDEVSIWLKLTTALVAVFAVHAAVRYAGQPLLEAHAFRQTQTALTSFWMLRDGWRLAYETPVGGYPWSIPFEFPLFQSLVALIAKVGSFPLDPVGRLLSFAFLMACAWPATGIARRLQLPRQAVWVFCALLWSSPIYLFWGRTFMMETTALFFAFAVVPFGLDLLNPHPSRRAVFLCAVFGTLASLQKVTTAAPVVAILACIWLADWLRRGGLRLPTLADVLTGACAFGLPLAMAMAWTAYTDTVKTANPFGTQLTSSALHAWNYGTLQQRLALPDVFWRRVFVGNAGGLVGVLLLAGALARPHMPRLRSLVLVALALFSLPLLTFTNLHIVHDYYQASCVLFLTSALALTIAVWLPLEVPYRGVVPLATLLLVYLNLSAFEAGYGPVMRKGLRVRQDRTLAVAEILRDYTPSGSGFVAFGFDWSSEVAYYAQRKSFTVPPWFRDYKLTWEDPDRFLGDTPLGALVVCPSAAGPTIEQVERRFESDDRWLLVEVLDCRLLLMQSGLVPASGVSR